MLFNSFEFIFLYLPIVLSLYFAFNKFEKYELAKGILVIASLYFYSYFNYSYLLVILVSIIANYLLGILLQSEGKTDKNRGVILGLGIVFNLAILCYFKYFDFFIKNINIFLKSEIALLNLTLPLGISFFTFQQLSFLIDNYKKHEKRNSFLNYCFFVTFFPQLIAGPIVLGKEMLPQIESKNNKKINYKNLNRGLYIFAMGLGKKVLIADTLSSFANAGFDYMDKLTFFESWITTISYSLQLYFDFSGYCDMAMGVALMFNIVLPLNFNSPYRAKNIQEFWKRWHITLGRFLTDYLYIPLGGNRKGELKTLRNLFVVFLVSGIWHGAGWMFIIWGSLHGISILLHRVWKKLGCKMSGFQGNVLTLFFINIFWVFFRANSLKDVKKILVPMFTVRSLPELISDEYRGLSSIYFRNTVNFSFLLLAILIIIFFRNAYLKMQKMSLKRYHIFEITIYVVGSILFLERAATFLYFNF